jgi:DNA-binding CsgD family transcriptional regulator
VHSNDEALRILNYPAPAARVDSLEHVLPFTEAGLVGDPPTPAAFPLQSGRRRYTCRVFDLGLQQPSRRLQPKLLLILERGAGMDLARWSEAHHLTERERQTVRLLLMGLSSKEIATQMSISPSTVKTFLKLVMAKVGAASRTGIVAKIIEENQQWFVG